LHSIQSRDPAALLGIIARLVSELQSLFRSTPIRDGHRRWPSERLEATRRFRTGHWFRNDSEFWRLGRCRRCAGFGRM